MTNERLIAYLKGLGVAVGTAVLLALLDYFAGGGDLREASPVILMAAATAARLYLAQSPIASTKERDK